MSITYENTGWLIIEQLASLITAEFTGAQVKKADLLRIQNYPTTGTFCLELIEDTPNNDSAPMLFVQSQYNFNIWIYLQYLDKEAGQEDIIDLVEHLKALLLSKSKISVANLWFDSDVTGVRYGIKEKVVNENQKDFLRAAQITWNCRVMEAREA